MQKKLVDIGRNMANRNKSYDEVLARKFRKPAYAQGYLINIIKREKLPVEEALRETIKAMGLKSFADKSGLSIQSVSDFVSKRSKWSMEKLATHVKQVFKLKVELALSDSKVGKKTA